MKAFMSNEIRDVTIEDVLVSKIEPRGVKTRKYRNDK